MQLLDVTSAGVDYRYQWPSGNEESFIWIEYRALESTAEHDVRIGFCDRKTYGQLRRRVVLWIDMYPYAEFVGADDFQHSGEVLSEIKVSDKQGGKMCRYPDETVPEEYAGLPTASLKSRVSGSGVHGAWAVVANVADHHTMFALAAVRRMKRMK